MAVLPIDYLNSDGLGELYIGSNVYFLSPLIRSKSQRRFLLSTFTAHAGYNLSSFGIPRMGAFCIGSFPPAPCSPPLGGSIADSAVRFTPAVKYGGRENQPSRRATSCMSSHPCRAHHKLKWARTEQSDIVLLYKQVPRSESIKVTSTQNCAAHPNSARSTLFDRGWQQPLNHHKAQPARRVKDAAGTAKPLVLDTARWLGYFLCLSTCHSFRAHILFLFSINAKNRGALTANPQ